MRAARDEAARQGADLVVFPELFIAGYPPEDLVLKPAFQAACRAEIEKLARETAAGGPALLVGTPWARRTASCITRWRCSTAGAIAALRFKVDLPNYGVFDEKRVFAAGPLPGPDEFPRRAAGRADLRGYLGRRTSSNASPKPAPKFWWCRTARRIGGRRATCASTSRSRASPSRGCR